MKKFLLIFSLSVLLSSLFAGCVRRGAAEARLIAIDSLIAASPDSALTLLAATDTAALAEADRAYHALLTAQAKYKAYIPATDSAAITRVWAYYSRSGPRDRRVRAMLYRGTTAEEMGDPVEAMRWYKRTELAAREIGDDRLAGIALLSMGVLYMNQYTTSKAQQKLKAALPMLDKTDDEHYKYTLELLGQSYAKASYDTACQYIEQLRLRSIARSDTFYLNTSRNLTITTLYYNNRYRATVDSLNAIPPEQRTFPSLHYGCVSLCKLGESDSARLFFDMAPPPATSVDSMLYLHSLAEISRAEKDYQDADNAETASSDISGSCLADAVADSKLPTAEAKALDEISGQSKIWHVVLVMVVTALMALIGLAARLFYTAKRANDSESRARELQRDIDRMANNRDQLASELGRISNKLSARLSESVSLSQQLEAAKKELAEAKARIEEAGKRHKKSLKQINQEKNDIKRELEDLEAQKHSLEQKCLQLQQEIDSVEAATSQSQAESERKETELAEQIIKLNNRLAQAAAEGQALSQRVTVLEAENCRLASNCDSMRSNKLVYAWKQLFTAIRKKIDEEELNKIIKSQMTEVYFTGIRRYVDITHGGLVQKMEKSHRLSRQEVNIVCMHLCGLPNSLIALYINRKTHSIPKIKSSISKKYFGDSDCFDHFEAKAQQLCVGSIEKSGKE